MFVQRGGAASNEQLSTLEILATSIGRIPRQEGYLARKDTSPGRIPRHPLTFLASGGLLPKK